MSNSKAYTRPQQAIPSRKEEEVRLSEANRRYTEQKGFAKDLGCEVTLEKKSFPWVWMSWALPSYLLVLPWSNVWKSQATVLLGQMTSFKWQLVGVYGSLTRGFSTRLVYSIIRADNKRSRSHTSRVKGHTSDCLFKLAALWEQGHAWVQAGVVEPIVGAADSLWRAVISFSFRQSHITLWS